MAESMIYPTLGKDSRILFVVYVQCDTATYPVVHNTIEEARATVEFVANPDEPYTVVPRP